MGYWNVWGMRLDWTATIQFRRQEKYRWPAFSARKMQLVRLVVLGLNHRLQSIKKLFILQQQTEWTYERY